eukprot:1147202-Pelagomonas_calceolata.AAC.4
MCPECPGGHLLQAGKGLFWGALQSASAGHWGGVQTLAVAFDRHCQHRLRQHGLCRLFLEVQCAQTLTVVFDRHGLRQRRLCRAWAEAAQAWAKAAQAV